MSEIVTTGSWKPSPGSEQAFVEAWASFAAWSTTTAGAGRLRLHRDSQDPQRFVSLGDWESAAAVRAWKSSPDFREQLAQVLMHVGDFHSTELELVASVDHGVAWPASPAAVHYRRAGIATFDVPAAAVFEYMRSGGHPHAAFKSHTLVGAAGNVVTVTAEVYNPDGSTFETTIEHTLDPPNGVETTMRGGPFDGARFVHSYTETAGRTSVDLEGDFPVLPGMAEAEELAMIDGFFGTVFAEDEQTLRTWAAPVS